MPRRRRLRAAALILYGLAAAGSPALAQNESSTTVGPPQLKDFTLPGQRTTPPATTPPPPAATTPPPSAPPRDAPAADPAPPRERPAARPRAQDPVPDAAAPARRVEPAPVATAPVEPPPVPLPEPQAQAQAPAPAAAAPPAASAWPWPAAAGGALLLLAAAFLMLRRRRPARRSARPEPAPAAARAPAAPPAPTPRPTPEPPPEPRPWLELDMVPDRAAATDSEAVVHYALTLTNQGDAEARNIRIDPRLFNAGAEADMAAFFQGPIHDLSGSPHIAIKPGASLKLNGQVAMPKAELREIEMAGRRIFVPMVAINVAYDWAGGTGRTSRSWLVGREAESPQAKMGPFRLDLGPRIYRSVGRREGRLVRV